MGDDPGRGTRRRLSVAQAADALGVTVDAIRSRIKRGTIEHERVGGRVYVLLSADQGTPSNDQGTAQGDRTAELIATLQDQLQQERQAHAEARRIIAGLVERIPALEAPADAPQSPDAATDEPDRGTGAEQPQAATQRPWWRRLWRFILLLVLGVGLILVGAWLLLISVRGDQMATVLAALITFVGTVGAAFIAAAVLMK